MPSRGDEPIGTAAPVMSMSTGGTTTSPSGMVRSAAGAAASEDGTETIALGIEMSPCGMSACADGTDASTATHCHNISVELCM